jgi:hypothetical protein
MSDLILLFVIVALPAAFVLAPLAIFALGIAAVANFDEDGLVRSAHPRRPGQPAPGSGASPTPPVGSSTAGPASRISSLTRSA